jgi:membrane-bound lytic murein transglycosylase A
MVAQDRGGAIKGALRADMFMGYGEQVGILAGQINHQGSLTMLVPK